MERRRSVQVKRRELAGHAGIVRRSVSGFATNPGDARSMKTTKPAEKKPAGDRKPRKPYYLLPRYPMYPESYVHAKGPSSTWRSNERNA
jgi:hypothetical protein